MAAYNRRETRRRDEKPISRDKQSQATDKHDIDGLVVELYLIRPRSCPFTFQLSNLQSL